MQMNSLSMPVKTPMSTILGKPGYLPGYQQYFQSDQGHFFPNKSKQMYIPVSEENVRFNGEFGVGMRSASGPSMSTPLTVFQNANGIRAQPKNCVMSIGKSLTSSMNNQIRPQRFSSYSQAFSSATGTPFNYEFEYGPVMNRINIVNHQNKMIHSNHGIQQHRVPYPVQPQLIPPNFFHQKGQNALIQPSIQTQMGVHRNALMGYPRDNIGENAASAGNYTQIRSALADQGLTKTSTFGSVQPQVFGASGEFRRNEEIKRISHLGFDAASNLDLDNRQATSMGHFNLQGRKMEPVTGGVTIKGFKPTVMTENQDRSLIIELGHRASAYAVFDGHGPHGDVIASFVSEKFSLCIMQLFASVLRGNSVNEVFPTRQQMKNFFTVLFNSMDMQLSELKYGISLWSGCTAALCVKINNEVHIAWAGDSRVVVFKFSKPLDNSPGDSEKSSTVSWWTTSDHVPNRPDELSRITNCGATITVYSTPWLNKSTTRIREHGIAMSRSFGDKAGSQFGVISKPDMASIKLDPAESAGTVDERWAIVVASDGIWDSLSEEEVGYRIMEELIWRDGVDSDAQFGHGRPTRDEVATLANSIASEAWRFRASVENYSDDTTILISVI